MLFELQPGALPDGYCESILSLAAAKAHLRVLHSSEDDVIEALRDAAVDMIEQMTSLYLARRDGLVWKSTGFGAGMVLGRGPRAEVASIAYDDTAGVEVVLAADDWRIGPHGRLLPGYGKSWPGNCGGEVRVTFSAGFDDVTTEKPALVTAVKMMLARLFDIRSDVVTGTIVADVPHGVAAICNLHRMPVV